jgi:predicted nucleic acid-binding protein
MRRVLIDTNVLIDYISEREPFSESARSILLLCMDKKLNGSIAAHSVMNAFYILRKEMTLTERREFLLDICTFLTVIGIDKTKIVFALENNNFSDVEDCLQVECAKEFNAEYIITRNIKDFTESDIPAISPDDYLKIMD